MYWHRLFYYSIIWNYWTKNIDQLYILTLHLQIIIYWHRFLYCFIIWKWLNYTWSPVLYSLSSVVIVWQNVYTSQIQIFWQRIFYCFTLQLLNYKQRLATLILESQKIIRKNWTETKKIHVYYIFENIYTYMY